MTHGPGPPLTGSFDPVSLRGREVRRRFSLRPSGLRMFPDPLFEPHHGPLPRPKTDPLTRVPEVLPSPWTRVGSSYPPHLSISTPSLRGPRSPSNSFPDLPHPHPSPPFSVTNTDLVPPFDVPYPTHPYDLPRPLCASSSTRRSGRPFPTRHLLRRTGS